MQWKRKSKEQRATDNENYRHDLWRRRLAWHTFFCLLPRRLDPETVVWLEFVQRRTDPEGNRFHNKWRYEYRTYQKALTEGAKT